MRNLYKRLGISQNASVEEIRRAIRSCTNAALRADAESALLVENHRRSYDRLNSLLTDIGRLRSSLGLGHSENWQGEEAVDYAQDCGDNRSAYDTLMAKTDIIMRQLKTRAFFVRVKNTATRLLAGVAVAALVWFIWQETSNSPKSSIPQTTVTPEPTFSAPVKPLPNNGIFRLYTADERVAPLLLKNSPGSNYLVKLKTVGAEKDVLSIFVRGGSTVDVEVPLGVYILVYASGQNWYGSELLFGSTTRYSKADELFNFSIESGVVHGYEVTLYTVRHGNLETIPINSSEF